MGYGQELSEVFETQVGFVNLVRDRFFVQAQGGTGFAVAQITNLTVKLPQEAGAMGT